MPAVDVPASPRIPTAAPCREPAPLYREVILRGVLRAHLRLEIAVQEHRPETGPVLRCAGGRAQDTVEWVGIDGSALRHKRSIEKRRRKIRAAAKRRFGSELFEDQLLHRVVEHAPTGTDACLAISTEQFSERPTGKVRAIRDSYPWSECLVIGLGQPVRHAL